MKTLVSLTLVLGIAVVTVVTCAPSFNRAPQPLPLNIACATLVCPDDYRPVCAVNAMGIPKTFSNRCFITFDYCKSRIYYVPIKEGEC